MATPRKLLLSGLVWPTAIAVGLAGLPSFHCHCVPGHTRPLALVAVTTGCCCTAHETDGCCPMAEETSDAEPPPCCRQAAVPVAEADKATLQGTAAVCTGSLSQAEAIVPSPELTVAHVHTATLCLLVSPMNLAAAPHACSVPFLEPDDRSPPTDRIIVFEHFLI